MRIISKKALRQFWETEKQAEIPLDNWYRTAARAAWRNFAELKRDFPAADLVGSCTVFNVGGNKYRLVAYINYRVQRLYVLRVLTHREYDTNKWKKDCK